MKKKGLIVATIVMVLVLAVSLTTATYAWFTVSASTSIDGFNLSVSAGNAVNIGLSPTNTYVSGASPDAFVSGDCSYAGTAGTLEGGWTGSVASLGATIDHTINWGEMDKAVGFSSDANVATDAKNATYANTKLATQPDWTRIVKANGNATTFTGNAEYAVANGNSTAPATKGDFVYLFMGAQPTKALQAGTNKLYIVVQSASTGSTIGMAAAVHVAYRVHPATGTATTTWQDKDVFTGNDYKTAKSGLKVELPWELTTEQKTATGGTFADGKTTIQNAAVVTIDLSNWDGTGSAPLDQFEIIVYLAGSDPDCIDAAKNGTINVFLFFGAQELVVAG